MLAFANASLRATSIMAGLAIALTALGAAQPLSPAAQASAPSGVPLGGFRAVDPSRILDTRSSSSPIGAGQARDVQIAGFAGVPLAGVSAVAITLTAVKPTATTSLTAYAAGTSRPTTSDLSLPAGRVLAEATIVRMGFGGRITVYNAAGSTHVVIDVSGYYGSNPGAGDRYDPRTPSRLLDSRQTHAFGDGETRRLQVLPRGSVGTSAVAVSVVVTGSRAEGYLSAFPAGQERPVVSNINYRARQTVANFIVARLSDGAIDIYTSKATHVVVDQVGFFGGAGNGRYPPIAPARIASRSMSQDESFTVRVTGIGGVPDRLPSAVAVAITATRPTSSGYLTVHPGDQARPSASNINTTGAETITGIVLAKVDMLGRITIFAHTGSTLVTVDVLGFYDRPAFLLPMPGIGGDRHFVLQTAHSVISADSRTAYVSKPDDDTVHAIDLVTGQDRSVTVGDMPAGVELSPDGRTLWVAETRSATLAAVDTTTLLVTRRIPVRPRFDGQYPFAIVIPADGRHAFVALSFDGSGGGGLLLEVDLTTGEHIPRPDLEALPAINEEAVFARNADRTVIFATLGLGGAGFAVWTPTDDTWRLGAHNWQGGSSTLLSTSDDGSVVLTPYATWRRQPSGTYSSTFYDHEGNVAVSRDGLTGYRLNPAGSVEVFATSDGSKIDEIHVADTFDSYSYRGNHRLALSWDGTTLVAIGRLGITVVRL